MEIDLELAQTIGITFGSKCLSHGLGYLLCERVEGDESGALRQFMSGNP